MNEKTRVLLADAADEFRHMAAEMIQQEADMEVVGQTGDGEELLGMVRSLRPQVLVLSLIHISEPPRDRSLSRMPSSA